MVQRIANTKVGDLFSIQINENEKRYFQYIVSDYTQLTSDVIRAFKTVYRKDEEPLLSEVVKDEVGFYAHCVTKVGIRRGIWKKEGNIPEVGDMKQNAKMTVRDSIFRMIGGFGKLINQLLT